MRALNGPRVTGKDGDVVRINGELRKMVRGPGGKLLLEPVPATQTKEQVSGK